jgi:RNA polymerase sigma-70 factor, ECF subfamily
MIGVVGTTALDRAAVEARPRLLALAYRMLGSMSDAEDVVQDALVKARRSAPTDVASPVAFLTTITTRTAIDHLRSARVRRESYVGPWLPEPVLDDPAPDASARAMLADSLSMALLVVLESLTPDERAALLLHDVFGYRHAEVAGVLGCSEAASRQLLRRARLRVEADRPRFPVDRAQHEALLQRFLAACQGGDMASFLDLLTDDAVYVADGGAEVKAARHPILGAVRVARLLGSIMGKRRQGRSFATVALNGEPGLAIFTDGELTSVVFVEPASPERIARIHWVRNPAKLARLGPALERGAAGRAASAPHDDNGVPEA